MKNIVRSRPFWILSVSLIIITVLIIYTSSGRTNVTIAEKLVADILAPFYYGASGVSGWVDSFGTDFAEKQALQQQIEQLQKENTELNLKNHELIEYRYEAKRLAQAMQFKQANLEYFDLELSRVIARSNKYWYQTLTIDKGESDGIQVNMAVITGDGLAGKIISVSHYTSEVMLLTDPQMAVGVAIQENRECNGIVEGLHDTKTLSMVNIPFYSKIKNGQTVITSGLSDIYPKGIVIGTVNRVIKESNGLTLTAAIDPAVDFDKLEELFVVMAYRQRTDEEIARMLEEDKKTVESMQADQTNSSESGNNESKKPGNNNAANSDKPSSSNSQDSSSNSGNNSQPDSSNVNNNTNNANTSIQNDSGNNSTINPGVNSPQR